MPQNAELNGKVLICFDELEKLLHSHNHLWFNVLKNPSWQIKESIVYFRLIFWNSIQFSFKNCESARLGSSLFLNDSFSQSDFRKRLTVVNKEKLLVENFYTEDFYQDTFSLRRFWVIEIPIRVLIASFFSQQRPIFQITYSP